MLDYTQLRVYDQIVNKPEVIRFLASSPRHKLLIVRDAKSIPNNTLDLGHALAQWIKEYGPRDSQFAYNLQYKVYNDVSFATVSVSDVGTVIPVSNIGILFEPQLGYTPEEFLKRFSKNDILILFWQGDIKGNRLYLPDVHPNCTIDLTEINHLVI